jgi:hypothetical protein
VNVNMRVTKQDYLMAQAAYYIVKELVMWVVFFHYVIKFW